MQVRDGMSTMVLTVGPEHTLREAARLMAERASAPPSSIDPDGPGSAILTERDLLRVDRHGPGPRHRARRRPPDHDVVFAAPDWSLEEAAVAMVRGGFRHLDRRSRAARSSASSRCATSCAAGPTTARSATCHESAHGPALAPAASAMRQPAFGRAAAGASG